MRLTILNQFYTPDISPTAHMAGSLAEHRAGLGDHVTVVASKCKYVSSPTLDPNAEGTPNLKIYRIRSTNLGKGSLIRRCVDYLTFHLQATYRMGVLPRQDVIISMTTPPFVALVTLFHRFFHRRTRIILWVQDCYPEMAERSSMIRAGGLISRLARSFNRFLFRRLDRLVVLDSAMKELMDNNYGKSSLAPLSIEIIPNWEKFNRFPSSFVEEPASVPASLERFFTEGKFVVLYLGNAGAGHRFEAILEIAYELRDLPFLFLFIGGGSKWRWIAEQKAERGLCNLELHGYISKEMTPAVMARAHCAFVTMRNETLGVISPSKIHSCLAMGLPLLYIGPARSNVDEAIERFDCGVSLRPNAFQGAMEFLKELRESPQKLQQLRRKARAAFEQAYSDRCSLPKFDRLLNRLG